MQPAVNTVPSIQRCRQRLSLFSTRLRFDSGFYFESSEALYQSLRAELYRFDMAYRHYSAASQRAHVDILKNSMKKSKIAMPTGLLITWHETGEIG